MQRTMQTFSTPEPKYMHLLFPLCKWGNGHPVSQLHSPVLCSDYMKTANVNILGNRWKKEPDAVMPEGLTGPYDFFDNRISYQFTEEF